MQMVDITTNEIIVSICCLTYNHEKYIRKTLEGFVRQKTTFPFEVIVHDDCSTDSTVKIIHEFEEKYPQIIKPIYQEENQYSKNVNIIKKYIYPQMHGKYVAFCEGDDYWTDSNKLQLQVEALKNHSNCSICFNRVARIYINGEKTGHYLPEKGKLKEGIIKSIDYLSYVAFPAFLQTLPLQLSGIMISSQIYEQYLSNAEDLANAFDVGDMPIFFYMGLKGDAYYIDRSMSCYRSGNADSWSGKINHSKNKLIEHLEKECKGFEKFDDFSKNIVHEAIKKGIYNRKFRIYQENHDIKSMKSKNMLEIYHSLTFKSKIMHHIIHYFPFGDKILRFIKLRKQYTQRNKKIFQ